MLEMPVVRGVAPVRSATERSTPWFLSEPTPPLELPARTRPSEQADRLSKVRRAALVTSHLPLVTRYTLPLYGRSVAHLSRDKKKLLMRVRRIRGQVEAIERALDDEQECEDVLQLIAAVRGATAGLMTEVMEGHIRFHVLDPDARPNAKQTQAAQQLINVLKTYLK